MNKKSDIHVFWWQRVHHIFFYFTAIVLEAIKNSGLPTFSPLVEKHLQENRIELVWNKYIAETATYFFSKNTEVGDSSHYRLIGEKMYLVYPCIKMEGGSHAWVSRYAEKIHK